MTDKRMTTERTTITIPRISEALGILRLANVREVHWAIKQTQEIAYQSVNGTHYVCRWHEYPIFLAEHGRVLEPLVPGDPSYWTHYLWVIALLVKENHHGDASGVYRLRVDTGMVSREGTCVELPVVVECDPLDDDKVVEARLTDREEIKT